jgi:hypothetical protein
MIRVRSPWQCEDDNGVETFQIDAEPMKASAASAVVHRARLFSIAGYIYIYGSGNLLLVP